MSHITLEKLAELKNCAADGCCDDVAVSDLLSLIAEVERLREDVEAYGIDRVILMKQLADADAVCEALWKRQGELRDENLRKKLTAWRRWWCWPAG